MRRSSPTFTPLLVPGGGACVDVPVQTQTPSSRQSAFAVRGARFFGSPDGMQYVDPDSDPFIA